MLSQFGIFPQFSRNFLNIFYYKHKIKGDVFPLTTVIGMWERAQTHQLSTQNGQFALTAHNLKSQNHWVFLPVPWRGNNSLLKCNKYSQRKPIYSTNLKASSNSLVQFNINSKLYCCVISSLEINLIKACKCCIEGHLSYTDLELISTQ